MVDFPVFTVHTTDYTLLVASSAAVRVALLYECRTMCEDINMYIMPSEKLSLTVGRVRAFSASCLFPPGVEVTRLLPRGNYCLAPNASSDDMFFCMVISSFM